MPGRQPVNRTQGRGLNVESGGREVVSVARGGGSRRPATTVEPDSAGMLLREAAGLGEES